MFRIHWKGCPHRRLPRIRLPSLRNSVSRALLAQDAAEAVHLLPFSPALKKAREQERIKARKRRRIRSRTRSNSFETTVSTKALRNIEVYGWDSQRHFDSLGAENIKIGSKEQGFLDSSKNYQIIDNTSRIPGGLVEYSGNRPRPCMDGAFSSKAPSNLPTKANIPKERRFTPAYLNKRIESGRDTLPSQGSSSVVTFGENRVNGTYLPHFSTTEHTQTAPTPVTFSRSRTVRIPIKRVPIKGVPITNAPSRSRTYDPRIPIKHVSPKQNRQRVTKSSPSSRTPDRSRRSSISPKTTSRSNKRRGWRSPEFRRALNSALNQQRDGAKELVSDIDDTEPSRTSSERRAVERFTSELAKSLADPEKIRRPTQPSTAPSIHTLEDLEPYAPEFRAAGLSVTVRDQVSNAPRLQRIQTHIKENPEDIAYKLRTFSFEMERSGPADGPADMQKSPAKALVWNSETPTDYTSSSGSTFTEGHHHVRRIKANANQAPPSRLPPNPPKPVAKTKTGMQETNPKMEKALPKTPVFHSPSDFTSSSGSMSWTEGHHHVRALKTNGQPKPVMREVKYAEITPTPAQRQVSTVQFTPLAQPPKKSIPWLQSGEISPRTRTEGPTAWQEQNIRSPTTMATSESSVITVIDWSPIEDPRANLAVFPLVARPTQVEWVEMNYDRDRQSTTDPTLRVVDMKRKPEWEEAGPRNTVDIMPVEQSKIARRKTTPDTPQRGPFRASPQLLDRFKPFDKLSMIVPVNVTSITPVSSVYSFPSSKKARTRKPDRPLLCTRCGRLLATPSPVLPPPSTKPHDCTRDSSLCEECAPSKIEITPISKRASVRPETPSPTGSPPPPIIPVRSLRRTGNLFHAPPIVASPSLESIPPDEMEQVDPVSISNDVLNKKFPPTFQTKIDSPKRMPPASVAISNRGSIDTITDIISHYSRTESTTAIASEAENPRSPRDKDIFRGLQVVTLAACDKDVDEWIKDMSGAQIRKFLVDVGEFEKLGIGELSRLARKTARKRKRELEKALKEKEANGRDVGQGQNDGVGDGSSGSGSNTVRDWKAIDTEHKKAGDTNRDMKMGFVAGDEPVCHVSGPGTAIKRNRAQNQHMDDETNEERCECNDERRIDKGKGKEKEKETQNQEPLRSRRDRFGFRDGHFH